MSYETPRSSFPPGPPPSTTDFREGRPAANDVSPFKEMLRTYAPLAVALIALAASMGWISKEQADTITKVIPILVAEKQPVEPEAVISEADPVAESMTPEQWADLIRGVIEQLKPVPQPTPVDPTPKPVDPLPNPPAGLAILVSDETGKPISSSTVEAGSLFRVSAVGAKGEISWQSVKSGDVRLSASTDGKEFAGYLSPGQWVDFGLTDYESRKQLSVRISCNQGPRPPPPNVVPVDPVDDSPVTSKAVWMVVIDDMTKTPTIGQTQVINSIKVWDEISAKGGSWTFYDVASPEAAARKAAVDAGNVPTPALVIYDKATGAKLAAMPSPSTVDELRAIQTKYAGGM